MQPVDQKTLTLSRKLIKLLFQWSLPRSIHLNKLPLSNNKMLTDLLKYLINTKPFVFFLKCKYNYVLSFRYLLIMIIKISKNKFCLLFLILFLVVTRVLIIFLSDINFVLNLFNFCTLYKRCGHVPSPLS